MWRPTPCHAINPQKVRYSFVMKRIVPLILMIFAALEAKAQYDVSFSHYWDMQASFNPAATGLQSKLNIAGAYALDFAGFEHNPRSMYLGADMPFYVLNNYHGAGVSLLSDQLGLFTHQRIALQYAFKKKLFGGELGAGLQVGFINEKFDGSEIDLEDSSDPAFSTSELTGNAFDLAFGLYFQHKAWYVGLSGQHLNAPLVELGASNELQIDRTYYLTGGYNIKPRNPFLSIPLSVLIRTDGTAWRADITARLVYTSEKRKLYGGLTYSPDNSVTVLVGGRFHGFHVGYSYEIYTSGLSIGNGSHELFVGYQTDLNLYKKGKNKHKSVRIL